MCVGLVHLRRSSRHLTVWKWVRTIQIDSTVKETSRINERCRDRNFRWILSLMLKYYNLVVIQLPQSVSRWSLLRGSARARHQVRVLSPVQVLHRELLQWFALPVHIACLRELFDIHCMEVFLKLSDLLLFSQGKCLTFYSNERLLQLRFEGVRDAILTFRN